MTDVNDTPKIIRDSKFVDPATIKEFFGSIDDDDIWCTLIVWPLVTSTVEAYRRGESPLSPEVRPRGVSENLWKRISSEKPSYSRTDSSTSSLDQSGSSRSLRLRRLPRVSYDPVTMLDKSIEKQRAEKEKEVTRKPRRKRNFSSTPEPTIPKSNMQKKQPTARFQRAKTVQPWTPPTLVDQLPEQSSTKPPSLTESALPKISPILRPTVPEYTQASGSNYMPKRKKSTFRTPDSDSHASSNSDILSGSDVPIVRRRGRPSNAERFARMFATGASELLLAPPVKSIESDVPRRRGRPRKEVRDSIATMNSVYNIINQATAHIAESVSEASDVPVVVVPKPRNSSIVAALTKPLPPPRRPTKIVRRLSGSLDPNPSSTTTLKSSAPLLSHLSAAKMPSSVENNQMTNGNNVLNNQTSVINVAPITVAPPTTVAVSMMAAPIAGTVLPVLPIISNGTNQFVDVTFFQNRVIELEGIVNEFRTQMTQIQAENRALAGVQAENRRLLQQLQESVNSNAAAQAAPTQPPPPPPSPLPPPRVAPPAATVKQEPIG